MGKRLPHAIPISPTHSEPFAALLAWLNWFVQILIGDFQRENPSGSSFLKNCRIMGGNVLW